MTLRRSPKNPTSPAALRIGSFVSSHHNALGTGTLQALTGNQATISYFCGPGLPVQQLQVPASSLRAQIQPQKTSCYLFDTDLDTWSFGTVVAVDHKDLSYAVLLRNGRTITAPTEGLELYVRCALPGSNPTVQLISGGHMGSATYSRRHLARRCLIDQRTSSRGITGLLSAGVNLLAHQAEVVRRVVSDAEPRYLLADEVGLGKTIEAGICLRQFLLDQPDGIATILVPGSLIEQWRDELTVRLRISLDDGRTHLLPLEAVLSAPRNTRFVIIDEAHHLARYASSRATPQQNTLFKEVREVATKAEWLLLLSATPVLHHESEFLTMLHLLDRETYPLADLKGFRERVELRQDLGRLLLGFKESAPSFILKKLVKEISTLFLDDERVQDLVAAISSNLAAGGSQKQALGESVRTLRQHIGDSYRLHRRMLRNRRESISDLHLSRTSDADVDVWPRLAYDHDERQLQVHEALEQWRLTTMTKLARIGAPDVDSNQYARLHGLMVQAAASSVEVLAALLASRFKQQARPELKQDWALEDQALICELPLLEGEAELIMAMATPVFKAPPGPDRPAGLMFELDKLLDPDGPHSFRKIVVFTGFPSVGHSLAVRTSAHFGKASVATCLTNQPAQTTIADVERFKNDDACRVLICDPKGEEGRNLQFADCIVHYDLPWSPNRIEQRIGRVDRIGRTGSVPNVILTGPPAMATSQDAWVTLLTQGFDIFGDSIASLQFYVDRSLPILTKRIFEFGMEDINVYAEEIRNEIDSEKVQISEQNVLDEIDILEKDALQAFETLRRYDRQDSKIRNDLEAYICGHLGFEAIPDSTAADTFIYAPSGDMVIDQTEVLNRFGPYLGKPRTYVRTASAKDPSVSLCRLGDPFIEAVSRFQEWDDSGQAFAVWRTSKDWPDDNRMVFRCDFVVTCDLAESKEVMGTYRLARSGLDALTRQGDGYFNPIFHSVFIDVHLDEIQDLEILPFLESLPTMDKRFRDIDLTGTRFSVINDLIDQELWPRLCRDAVDRARTCLQERLADVIAERVDAAREDLQRRLSQSKRRLDRLRRQPKPSEIRELRLEKALLPALLNGMEHPAITLDSVGFLVLSNQTPPGL